MDSRPTGKRGAVFGARPPHAATFAAFFDAANLPAPPASFGHYKNLGPLGMLANDRLSDCVVAMACHRVMYWAAAAGRQVTFSDASAISTYSEATGYSPIVPFSDQGTDMSAFPDYWQRTGILDAHNNRHRIDLWVTLELGDWDNFIQACWLFDGCDMGVALPSDAESMFAAGHPWWGANHGAQGDGHGVAAYGINSKGSLVLATWGDLQACDRAWWEAYTVWLDCPVSIEALDAKGLSPEGYDRAGLLDYARRLRQ
jgi:hypothetical protein